MLRTADLEYELPESSIAVAPASPRDSARMMVVSRTDRGLVEHRRISELSEVLRAGDLIVLNDTSVLPARFRGERLDSGGAAQGLFLGDWRGAPGTPPRSGGVAWVVLVKCRRQAPGVRLRLFDRTGADSGLVLELVDRCPDESGAWVGRVESIEGSTVSSGVALERIGLTPLPPYILQARKHAGHRDDDDADRAAYQTVFARPGTSAVGSVAAPTAGLHFSDDLLANIERAGVALAGVTLHVGTGTFKPVESEFVEQHAMHGEWCAVPAETGDVIHRTKEHGGRVIAIGTTTARTLESFETMGHLQRGASTVTHLLITPGYRWKHVDALLTNFHLPRSTLLALAGAFLDPDGGGVERLLSLYRLALEKGYRFYSFGDAMLILP